MEDKYKQLDIAQYSRNLAQTLCDAFFAGQETINGQQLITFSPVKQINLFVIKELLIRWNREMANLQSPYFDFSSSEVKDALKTFMNVLSRKILVRRPEFEPLLQQAIADTFTLVLQPEESFNEKFLLVQEEVTLTKLQDHLKYLDLNKNLFGSFLKTIPATKLEKTAILDQLRVFLQDPKNERVSPESLFGLMNPLLPLPVQQEDTQEKAEPIKAEPIETPAAPAPQPVTPQPVAPVQLAEASPTTAKPAVAAPHAPEVKLYEKFKSEKPSLNEMLRKPEGPILAEKDNRKIETLKESISINQRFAFINELFNGENLEYYETIQKLDTFTDAESAKNYLLLELAAKHNWVKKEEHLNKLVRLIDRKFAQI